MSKNLVGGLIERFNEIIAQASLSLPAITRSESCDPVPVDSITDFWEGKGANLVLGTSVAIRGALSTFAPALPGVLKHKRDLHRETRRHLREIQERLREQGYAFGPTTEDALLAYTSGQMVVRQNFRNIKRVYLGFYESIVRNSIPVFVEKQYYDQVVNPLFCKAKSDVVQVRLIGRLDAIERNQLMEFIHEFGLQNIYEPELLNSLMPRRAIHVDGPKDTGQVIGLDARPRYLDGDIWVALRNGGPDRVVSRFLDLADPIDLRAERDALRNDVATHYRGMTVVSEFDQLHRIFDSEQIIDPTCILRRLQSSLNTRGKQCVRTNVNDVFLSHNTNDKTIVRELARKLESRGISVWLDEGSLTPGQPSQATIEAALLASGAIAVLVGPSGLGRWQSLEMAEAIQRFVEAGRPVVPVLLPGCPENEQLPVFLKYFTWVNLREGITLTGLDNLEWGIKGAKPCSSQTESEEDRTPPEAQELNRLFKE